MTSIKRLLQLAIDIHLLPAIEGTGFLHLMEVTEPRFTVPCRKYFFENSDSSDALPREREDPAKSG